MERKIVGSNGTSGLILRPSTLSQHHGHLQHGNGIPSKQHHIQQQQQQQQLHLQNSHIQHQHSNYLYQSTGHHVQQQQQQIPHHPHPQIQSKGYSHYNNNGGPIIPTSNNNSNHNNILNSTNIHQQQQLQQQQQHFYGSTTTSSHHPGMNGHVLNAQQQQQQHSFAPVVHQIQQQQRQQQQQQQQQQIQQHQQNFHQQVTSMSNTNIISNGMMNNSSNYHSHHYQPAETEGLPQTLVDSMRTLFDILDDTKQGKIRLSDIESRWETDHGGNGTTGAEPLIKMGVMDFLRKVTPPDGHLTFERFCAGLRLALLTNNNNNSLTAQNQNIHPIPPQQQQQQQQQIQPHQQQQQQHQTFHQQVKNMANNLHSMNNIHSNTHNNNHNNHSQSNSNTLPSSISKQSMLSLQGSQVGASTMQMQRTSKIPSLSSSRLPMPSGGSSSSSGIPVSPTRTGGNPNNNNNNTYSSNNGPMMNGTGIPTSNNNNMSGINTNNNNPSMGRHNNNNNSGHVKITSEQGTTVALVHHQPKTPGIPSYSSSTLKIKKQSSTSASTLTRYNAKNGSLDNLKSPNEEKMTSSPSTKDRPPSAPLLDNDVDGENQPKDFYVTTRNSQMMINNNNRLNNSHHHNNNNHNQSMYSNISSNNANRRERARSRDRDRTDDRGGKLSPDEIDQEGGGLKRVNFVSPRQRTLSMPQLQLSKLKPKSIVNIDDSPPSTNNPPPPPSTTNSIIEKKPYTSATAVANGLKGKSVPLVAPSFVSAIPTVGMMSSSAKQKSDNVSPTASGSSSNTGTVERDKKTRDENIREKEQPPPPPKPPRGGGKTPTPAVMSTSSPSHEIIITDIPQSGGSSAGSGNGSQPSKPEIRTVLGTWQKGLSEKKPLEVSLSTASTVNSTLSVISNGTSVATAPLPTTTSSTTNNNNSENELKLRANNSKTNLRRRETPRRYTVQSGIDFATLKRLKQLEQEKEVLQQGISYLTKAKEWYHKQLEDADDKIGLLSKGAQSGEYWSESHEERLNLLGCRVSEVNSLLSALMDGTSLPLHMNLQLPTHLSIRTITRLKEQNRQLTQEVSDCGHRVTQLETEKAMLLRQLFHQKNNHHSEETVYM